MKILEYKAPAEISLSAQATQLTILLQWLIDEEIDILKTIRFKKTESNWGIVATGELSCSFKIGGVYTEVFINFKERVIRLESTHHNIFLGSVSFEPFIQVVTSQFVDWQIEHIICQIIKSVKAAMLWHKATEATA